MDIGNGASLADGADGNALVVSGGNVGAYNGHFSSIQQHSDAYSYPYWP